MKNTDIIHLKICRTLQKLKVKYQDSGLTPKKQLEQLFNDVEKEFGIKLDKDEKFIMESARDLVATLYLRFKV